ncbi:acyltransferase [Actinacidiphila sp. ITFR-21]|uniref:acyltransferase n=1 Tax=Actinacidiphila sp. ITFR-21 TaxID=3075199 RepID=UPI002889215E|nr:acyltransferase [Streptomyces sp. ITFR-21]WNI16857.1 acyltransferase [Streptomyces sp. ITFR-21]
MGDWSRLRGSRTVRPESVAEPPVVVRCGLTDTLLGELTVSVAHGFATAPDEERLAAGLAAALDRVPLFAGRLRAAGGGLEIVCDGSGVPVDSYDVDAPLGEVMGRVTLPGAGLVDHVEATKARAGEAPLLTVRISRTSDGGAVLGVSWHHAVGDVQSFVLLMRAWSAAVEGRALPEVELVTDRDAYLDRVLPAEDCGRPGFRVPGPDEAAVLAREVAVSGRANRTVQVYFGDAETDRMRETYSAAAGRRLSSGDVLCAHVVCAVRELDGGDGAGALTVPVNVRRPLGLPQGVLGNLLGEINLDTPAGCAPEQLAARLRAAVADFTGSHLNLRANRAFLDSVGQTRLGDCVPLGFDPARRRITFSNWRGFGLYDLTFGSGPALFFSPAANLQLPWVVWLVEGFGNTGSLLTAALPARLAGRLRGAEGHALLHRFRAPDDVLPPAAHAVRRLA